MSDKTILVGRLRHEASTGHHHRCNGIHQCDCGFECSAEGLMEMAADEIERLQTENWQLRQACGYPIPADKETPQNPFKCGTCDARSRDSITLVLPEAPETL
jgi:hypothetical protein